MCTLGGLLMMNLQGQRTQFGEAANLAAVGRELGFAIQSRFAVSRHVVLAALVEGPECRRYAGQDQRNLTARCSGPGRGVGRPSRAFLRIHGPVWVVAAAKRGR